MSVVSSTTEINSTSSQQAPSTIPAPSGGTVPSLAVPQKYTVTLNNGTTADNVDLNHVKTYTLSASATTIDLTSLLDRFGGAVNFARVKRLIVRSRSVTDGQVVTVSGGGSNPWAAIWGATGSVIVAPGTASNPGILAFIAPNTTGYAVSGTSKTIKLDPGANTIIVDVEIEGCSA